MSYEDDEVVEIEETQAVSVVHVFDFYDHVTTLYRRGPVEHNFIPSLYLYSTDQVYPAHTTGVDVYGESVAVFKISQVGNATSAIIEELEGAGWSKNLHGGFWVT